MGLLTVHRDIEGNFAVKRNPQFSPNEGAFLSWNLGQGRRFQIFRPVLLLLLLILALSGCGKGNGRNTGRYTDPQFHFRLPVPRGWSATDSTGMARVLVFLRDSAEEDGFHPNATVTAEPLPTTPTEEEYGRRNLLALRQAGYTVLEAGPVTTSHQHFFRIRWENPGAAPPLRIDSYCFVRDRVGFVLTAVAPASAWARYRPVFRNIVEGFRFE